MPMPRSSRRIDDKSANRLSPADLSRVLRDDPAVAYLEFSLAFLAGQIRPGGQGSRARTGLQRWEFYDCPTPGRYPGQAQGRASIALIDRHIERQTPFVEFYELFLARILKALNREKEITPRLEAAARRGSRTSRSSTSWPIATARWARSTRRKHFTKSS